MNMAIVRKISYLAIVAMGITCSSATASELQDMMRNAKPVSSSYIGKRWMAFSMNNGPSFKWEKLPDGGTLQYWRSDIAGVGVSRYDDGMASMCRLIIRTDMDNRIVEIGMLENGSACGPALR